MKNSGTVHEDNFDYTEWRRDYFDKMSDEEYHKAAVEYAKNIPSRARQR